MATLTDDWHSGAQYLLLVRYRARLRRHGYIIDKIDRNDEVRTYTTLSPSTCHLPCNQLGIPTLKTSSFWSRHLCGLLVATINQLFKPILLEKPFGHTKPIFRYNACFLSQLTQGRRDTHRFIAKSISFHNKALNLVAIRLEPR